MDVNDYYDSEEAAITEDDTLSEAEKQRYLRDLRHECMQAEEEEAAEEAERDGYRRYM